MLTICQSLLWVGQVWRVERFNCGQLQEIFIVTENQQRYSWDAWGQGLTQFSSYSIRMQLKKILLLPTPRVIVNTLDDTPDTIAEFVA